MNRTEYLLTCLGEECNEVAQRVSKILRFGINEVQPGQTETNLDRLNNELMDLVGAVLKLKQLGVYPIYPETRNCGNVDGWERVKKKGEKIEKFFEYSRERGLIHEEPV